MKKQQATEPPYDFSGVKLWQKGVEWDGYDVRLERDEQASAEQDPFDEEHAAGSDPVRGGITKKKKLPFRHTPIPDAVWYADPPVTGARLAVLAYICRHQVAFSNKFTTLTIDEFALGRFGRGKRMDRGCGITSRTAICQALAWLLADTDGKPWLMRVNTGSGAHPKYAYWLNLAKIDEIQRSFEAKSGVAKVDSTGEKAESTKTTPPSSESGLDHGERVAKVDCGRVAKVDSHIKETSGEADTSSGKKIHLGEATPSVAPLANARSETGPARTDGAGNDPGRDALSEPSSSCTGNDSRSGEVRRNSGGNGGKAGANGDTLAEPPAPPPAQSGNGDVRPSSGSGEASPSILRDGIGPVLSHFTTRLGREAALHKINQGLATNPEVLSKVFLKLTADQLRHWREVGIRFTRQ